MAGRWCTVTVTDGEGRRYSLDVLATNTYDAAYLYVTQAKQKPAGELPEPTLATMFEVVTGGRLYHVDGKALQQWILQRRND